MKKNLLEILLIIFIVLNSAYIPIMGVSLKDLTFFIQIFAIVGYFINCILLSFLAYIAGIRDRGKK